MPVHERLFFAKSKIGLTIDDDRPCQRCSYSLRGLRIGDRCPECGTPIVGNAAQRFSNTMSDAPLNYLTRLAKATMVMTIGGIILAIGVVFVVFASSRPVIGMLACSVGLLGACLWLLGVWGVTVPRETGTSEKPDAGKDWAWCRVMSRASQAGWILAMLSFSISFAVVAHAQGVFAAAVNANPTAFPVGQTALTPTIAVLLGVFGVFCMAVSLIGVAFVAAYLALLSDWAHDTALSSRLRMAPVLVTIATPLLIVAVLSVPFLRAGITGLLAVPVGGLSALIFLGCVGMFVVAFLQFNSLCAWARTNAMTRMTRDTRLSDRISGRIERAQAQAEPEYVPPAWAAEARTKSGARGNYLPSSEGEIYRLAPDDQPKP
jgi:hypothetical protein